MTDEQIVKALLTVAYGGHSCAKCKYGKIKGENRCGLKGCYITREAFDLINRQKSTIDELTKAYKSFKNEKEAEIESLKEAIVSKNLTPIEYKVRKEHNEKHIHIINGLEAEIEKLKAELEFKCDDCKNIRLSREEYRTAIKKAKSEAVKEFAKFLVDNKIDVVDLTAEFLERGDSE